MLYALLFLVICVYAIIGMVAYGRNKIEFGSIDIFNFETFGQSVTLLIQVRTKRKTQTNPHFVEFISFMSFIR